MYSFDVLCVFRVEVQILFKFVGEITWVKWKTLIFAGKKFGKVVVVIMNMKIVIFLWFLNIEHIIKG